MQAVCRQEGAEAVREGFPQDLHGRGRTVLAPSGPTRRQERGSRRWADPAAAVRLEAGCSPAWQMVEGPRRAQSHSRQPGVQYQLLLLYAGESGGRFGPKTV